MCTIFVHQMGIVVNMTLTILHVPQLRLYHVLVSMLAVSVIACHSGITLVFLIEASSPSVLRILHVLVSWVMEIDVEQNFTGVSPAKIFVHRSSFHSWGARRFLALSSMLRYIARLSSGRSRFEAKRRWGQRQYGSIPRAWDRWVTGIAKVPRQLRMVQRCKQIAHFWCTDTLGRIAVCKS